jgi:Baseplate J-like protein
MIFRCCNENRKAAVLKNPALNGIDYLELLDNAECDSIPSLRQRTLLVYCLNPVTAINFTPNNVLITGGESITGITAEWISPSPAVSNPPATGAEATYFATTVNNPNLLVVRTSEWGDFSEYVFRLVSDASAATQDPFEITEVMPPFDPQLAEVKFSFKVECGPEFDCAPVPPNCPPDLPTPPPINYLAKDYTTFRQVMLDRVNQLLPAWGASSEADMGIMLAELVSYACDQLSYRQDAVTTEAYLNTARSRISLRRHARLVDYFIHEGCNARVWMQINVNATTFLDHTKTRFYTTAPGMPSSLEVTAGNEQAALIAGVVAFEPMEDANLFPEQNSMSFYTWGDTNCCLPQGAIEATLQGTFSNLEVGDVLIFQEMMGPQTGVAADADVRHRCAVRLTAVTTRNALGQPLVDPLFDVDGDLITSSSQQPEPVTEIQWAADDALPFPLCISSQFLGSDGTEQILPNVSVALGNVVLTDQGLTMQPPPQQPTALGTVPNPTLKYPPNPTADRCQNQMPNWLPVRFRPAVPQSPVTQAVPQALVGSPSSEAAVPLSSIGPVSMADSNGYTALMVSANSPLTWPQYFGVTANVNASDSSLFDLAVMFAPSGSNPAGLSTPAVLEQFTGLSLTPATPNYALTQLANSNFVSATASLTTTVPGIFPSAPTMLPNSGTINLVDGTASKNPYLTIAPTNPLSWPPLFSVLAQGYIGDPDMFNLLLLYWPASGSAGVTLPVLAEEFDSVSLQNVTTKIGVTSDLISVQTFEDQPSPSLSATELMVFDADGAVPKITLTSTLPASGDPSKTWTAQPDLLEASAEDTQFVMEVDTDGTAYLRFGDGTNGLQPVPGTVFTAIYRVGNGTPGNVGANCLTNFAAGVVADSTIASCTNPMPAGGGIDPETAEQICRRAPQAFITQERAITMQDYVNVVERNPQIEDAAATLRWTGSWYTVFICAEPLNNANMSKTLRRNLTRTVNEYRLAGQDILIEPPQYVPLNIELAVCVDPDYFQRDVEQALLQVLGSGTLPNGQPALFAPQNFELGQPVYLSPIYTVAHTVAGLLTATARVFEPEGQKTKVYLQQGFIPMGPFQVARLGNDRSLPGNGRLRLKMMGGK